MIRWSEPGRRQEGQALILIGLMMVALTAAVGLAIDGGIGYSYNTKAERAAGSAALSGVVMMPDQFDQASARAVEEAALNGFDVNDTANNVQVTPAPVANYENKLSVTVCRDVQTTFMQLFGVGVYTVCRTATATYLPPLSLGEPGAQLGSTVSALGVSGYYFIRSEGYDVNRDEGDPFTPRPDPVSTDMHALNAATGAIPPDTVVQDASLPNRGGYVFKVNLPQGGFIQVYNAAFAPAFGTQDYCENDLDVNTGLRTTCNTSGDTNMYLHEEDSFGANTATHYAAMRYTVSQVNNRFDPSQDTQVSQMTVMPIDASQGRGPAPRYTDVNTGAVINQVYDPSTGAPLNMTVYHEWTDVVSGDPVLSGDGDGVTDPSLVTYQNGPYGGFPGNPLPPGLYRLRVDVLQHDGSLPPNSGPGLGSKAHKAIAVRALNQSALPCGADSPPCTVGAESDFTYFTPLRNGTFSVPILCIPPDYAGQDIVFQMFDPGDSSGNVWMSLLDPSGNVFTAQSPKTADIYDLGKDRTAGQPGTLVTPLGNQTATVQTTRNGSVLYNGHWLQVKIWVPNDYTASPSCWWSIQYQTTGRAVDTVGFAVQFPGNPAHILQS